MQDSRKMLLEEGANLKPKKKKSQRALMFSAMQGNNYPINARGMVVPDLPPSLMPSKSIKKISKKHPNNGLTPLPCHPQQRLVTEAGFPEGPMCVNEFDGLVRKYMILEEENDILGKEWKEVDDEIKSLEDEKLQLLDQLLVLEGLVDPSELQNR